MSKPRQPYITLKQFANLLESLRYFNVNLSINSYWLVTFPVGTGQDVKIVKRSENWNAIDFVPSCGPIVSYALLDDIKAVVDVHPDAAVTINSELFTGFDVTPKTNTILFQDTTLNTTSVPRTPEEFVEHLNNHKINTANVMLDLALTCFPDSALTIYRVGDRWMTQADLLNTYPKLSNYSYGALFSVKNNKMISARECKIPEAKMQQHFGLQTKNLIEQLLDEANAGTEMK